MFKSEIVTNVCIIYMNIINYKLYWEHKYISLRLPKLETLITTKMQVNNELIVITFKVK